MERLDSLFRVTTATFIKESVQNNKKKKNQVFPYNLLQGSICLTAVRLNADKCTDDGPRPLRKAEG